MPDVSICEFTEVSSMEEITPPPFQEVVKSTIIKLTRAGVFHSDTILKWLDIYPSTEPLDRVLTAQRDHPACTFLPMGKEEAFNETIKMQQYESEVPE